MKRVWLQRVALLVVSLVSVTGCGGNGSSTSQSTSAALTAGPHRAKVIFHRNPQSGSTPDCVSMTAPPKIKVRQGQSIVYTLQHDSGAGQKCPDDPDFSSVEFEFNSSDAGNVDIDHTVADEMKVTVHANAPDKGMKFNVKHKGMRVEDPEIEVDSACVPCAPPD